jgi:hypothetical protein
MGSHDSGLERSYERTFWSTRLLRKSRTRSHQVPSITSPRSAPSVIRPARFRLRNGVENPNGEERLCSQALTSLAFRYPETSSERIQRAPIRYDTRSSTAKAVRISNLITEGGVHRSRIVWLYFPVTKEKDKDKDISSERTKRGLIRHGSQLKVPFE